MATYGFIRPRGAIIAPSPLSLTDAPIASVLFIALEAKYGNMPKYKFLGIKTPSYRNYILVDDLFPSLYIDGVKATRQPGSYNACAVYKAGSDFLFRSNRIGVNILFGALREPYAYFNDESGLWGGEGWYEGGTYAMTSLSPKGAALNGTPPQNKTVEVRFNGYERSSSLHGEYSAFGDASGTFIFGEPYWERNGVRYVRFFTELNGYARFTNADSDAYGTKFFIGVNGSWEGWWEAAPPTPKQAWTFNFAKPQGSDAPIQQDITLAWGGWTEGLSETELMMATAGVLHG